MYGLYWISKLKNERLYLYGLNNLLNRLLNFSLIKSNLNELSKTLKLCPRSVYYWFSGQRPIPILSFIKIINFLGFDIKKLHKEIEDSLTGISCGSGPRKKLINLPFYLNENLSYFVGYLFGDGCLKSKEWTINFADEYFCQIDKINNILFDIFGVKGKIYSQKNKTELVIYSKLLSLFFNKLFEMPIGTKGRIKVPRIINKEKSFSLYFLKGFSDADGGICRIEEYGEVPKWFLKRPSIEIASKYQNILEGLNEILIKYGVLNSKVYYHKNNDSYRLMINGKRKLLKCNNLRLFEHPMKKSRLESLSASVA